MSHQAYPDRDSWQPDARAEQKRMERYRKQVAEGDHLLPWQRLVVGVVEDAEPETVIVSPDYA